MERAHHWLHAIFIFFKRWSLLIILFLFLYIFFYFNLQQYLTFTTLKKYQAIAQHWTLAHYKISVMIYLLTFILLIACTIPCATLFTLVGGFLFGSIAILYAVFSITVGGSILFFAVRTALGPWITKRSSRWLSQVEKKFQQHAFHYLLLFRLMPVFPCWISNIAAGALNIPYLTFLFATVLGVTPATIIYALAGRGLEQLLEMSERPDLHLLLTPAIFFPLLGLSLLSIFPIFYKRVKK